MSKNKKEVIYHRGEFLNTPGHHSCANILASIVLEHIQPDGDGDVHVESRINFTIGDCSRNINLEFDGYSYDIDDIENSVYKAELLAEVVGEFAKHLRENWFVKMKEQCELKERKKQNRHERSRLSKEKETRENEVKTTSESNILKKIKKIVDKTTKSCNIRCKIKKHET